MLQRTKVTDSFGAVLPADRWKCSFLEMPNERETFVKYWHSNGASDWVYTWGLCEVGNSEDQIRWPKWTKCGSVGTWLSLVQSVDKEQWKEFTLQRSWELVAVLPGSHSVPCHSEDRYTNLQTPATSHLMSPSTSWGRELTEQEHKPLKKRASQVRGLSLFLSPQSSWDRINSYQAGTCYVLSLWEPNTVTSLWSVPAFHHPHHLLPFTLLSWKRTGCPQFMIPRNTFPAMEMLPPLVSKQSSEHSVGQGY